MAEWKPRGELAEWLMAPVLKTGRVQALGGSNPSLSAKYQPPQGGSYWRAQSADTGMAHSFLPKGRTSVPV